MTEMIELMKDGDTIDQPGLRHIIHLPRTGSNNRSAPDEGADRHSADGVAAISGAMEGMEAASVILLRTATRHVIVTRPGGVSLVGDGRLNLGMALRRLSLPASGRDWRPVADPSFADAFQRTMWALLTRFARTRSRRCFRIESGADEMAWLVDHDGICPQTPGMTPADLCDALRRATEAGHVVRYRMDDLPTGSDGARFGPLDLLGCDVGDLHLDRTGWPDRIPPGLSFARLCATIRLAHAVAEWAQDEADIWFQLRGETRQILMTGQANETGLSIVDADATAPPKEATQ